MPMTLGNRQEVVGDQLYFWPSPNHDETRCMVIGHGAKLHGDVPFIVVGATVRFLVAHGSAITSSVGKLMSSMTLPHPLERYAPGSMCEDYSLTKFLGWHGGETSYVELWRLMIKRYGESPHVCPHVVSIRNRSIFKSGKVIKLSQVIPQVIAHEPMVNEIWMAGCREEHTKLWSLVKAKARGG